MGAKTWLLVYSNGNAAESLKNNSEIDRNKTIELVNKLFPKEKLELIEAEDITLLAFKRPPLWKFY